MLSTFMPSSHLDAFTLDIANADGLAVPVLGGAVKPSTLWVSAPAHIVRLQEGLNCIGVDATGHIRNSLTSAFATSAIPLYAVTVREGAITDVQDYRTQDARLNAAAAVADPVIKTVNVPLTDAQIKGLNVPLVVVPPTEVLGYVGAPLTVPIVQEAVLVFNTLGGAYVDPGEVRLVYGADFSQLIAAVDGTSPLSVADSKWVRVTPLQTVENIFSGNFQDNGIYLTVQSAIPLTGGDASNWGYASLSYRVMTLPVIP